MKKYLILFSLFLASCSSQNVVKIKRVCNNRNSYLYFQCIEDSIYDKRLEMEETLMNEVKKQALEMSKEMGISAEEAERILINSILEQQTSLNKEHFYNEEEQ
jgi:hypothetical protein